MVPLARALVCAGHEVAFATSADFCPRVERAGFQTFPAGLGMAEQLAQARRRFPAEAAMPPSKERFLAFVPRMLAAVAAPPRAADLAPILARWRPDVLIHDVADFGGPLAASAAHVPYADHSVGLLRPLAMARLAGEILAPVASAWDVDLGEMGGLFRYLYLDVCPPSLQSSEISQVSVAHPLRNVSGLDTADGDVLPPWVETLPRRSTIYVTLGTIFNQDRTVFESIIAGLREEPVNVILTVGHDNDPAEMALAAPNLHVERYIPLSLLLPHLDAVITQGGTSLLPVLGAGLPLLVLPQGADQFHHAEACVASGAGRCLLPGEVTPGSVRREVSALLSDPGLRIAARRVQRELDLMAPPTEVVLLLECLAQDRQPLERSRFPIPPRATGRSARSILTKADEL